MSGKPVTGQLSATADGSDLVNEGIYVVRTDDGAYVGQSGDIPTRLAQHVYRRKFTQAEVDAAERSAVSGGKTAREVAEQLKLDELGGRDAPGILNLVNPIGDGRLACCRRDIFDHEFLTGDY